MLKRVSEAQMAAVWNLVVPVGTPVRYWTGAREGEGKPSKTRSEAQLLGGHTAVVWVEGHSGCIALSHVYAEVSGTAEDGTATAREASAAPQGQGATQDPQGGPECL